MSSTREESANLEVMSSYSRSVGDTSSLFKRSSNWRGLRGGTEAETISCGWVWVLLPIVIAKRTVTFVCLHGVRRYEGRRAARQAEATTLP